MGVVIIAADKKLWNCLSVHLRQSEINF